MYLEWPSSNTAAPKLQLVGFQRVPTTKAKYVNIDFIITGSQMAVWVNDELGMKILPGNMTVYVGGQQPAQTTAVPSNILKDGFNIL